MYIVYIGMHRVLGLDSFIGGQRTHSKQNTKLRVSVVHIIGLSWTYFCGFYRGIQGAGVYRL